MTTAIEAADLEARLAGLVGIGQTSAGVTRLAWTAEAEACRAAVEQIAALTRMGIELRTASRSEGVVFDPGVRAALRRASAARDEHVDLEDASAAATDALRAVEELAA